MKHGKLGIKELHTGRNVCVLLYSGLVTDVVVCRKAEPFRQWIATESILGKPGTRKDIFDTELNALLSADGVDLLVPESDLRDRIQIFTTKEKAIKWARRQGRETTVISGEKMLEVLNPYPIFRHERRRITDPSGAKAVICEKRLDNGDFGTKVITHENSRVAKNGFDARGLIKRRSMMMGVIGQSRLEIIKQVSDDMKHTVKGFRNMVTGTAPGTPLHRYLYLVLGEIIDVNSIARLEFKYTSESDVVEIIDFTLADGAEPLGKDVLSEMLHVICTDYLDDIHVQVALKDGLPDLRVDI